MVKAILFDMDGVLIDSYDAWFNLFNSTLKNYSLKEISRKEFSKNVWAQDFSVVTGRYIAGKDVEEVAKFYFSNFMNFKKYLKKIKNVKVLLGGLEKKGIKTAVVTNTYHEIAEELLNAVELYKYFDLILGGDDVDKAKPAPDMLLLACKKLNVEVKDVFMVGDTSWDKVAADKAKVKFVGYKLGEGKTINDLKELLSLLSV